MQRSLTQEEREEVSRIVAEGIGEMYRKASTSFRLNSGDETIQGHISLVNVGLMLTNLLCEHVENNA